MINKKEKLESYDKQLIQKYLKHKVTKRLILTPTARKHNKKKFNLINSPTCHYQGSVGFLEAYVLSYYNKIKCILPYFIP